MGFLEQHHRRRPAGARRPDRRLSLVRDGGKRLASRAEERRPEKRRSVSLSLRWRGGQGCCEIRARGQQRPWQRHQTSHIRETAAKSRSAPFFVRSERPAFTARCTRRLPVVLASDVASCARRAPGWSRPRAVGPGMTQATDGKRVRKRSGHAAADSTMAR
jgi:hypothetical protein